MSTRGWKSTLRKWTVVKGRPKYLIGKCALFAGNSANTLEWSKFSTFKSKAKHYTNSRTIQYGLKSRTFTTSIINLTWTLKKIRIVLLDPLWKNIMYKLQEPLVKPCTLCWSKMTKKSNSSEYSCHFELRTVFHFVRIKLWPTISLYIHFCNRKLMSLYWNWKYLWFCRCKVK